MALRNIIEQGDAILTKVCRPVTVFNDRLHMLLDDMVETLDTANGAGLAAPQVGILRRVCVVVDLDTEEHYELVNPVIVEQDGEQEGLEGCLSVPGKWGMVLRPEHVVVRAQNRDGDFYEIEAAELLARTLCHEIEHLDGHLYTEHIDHFLSDEELEEYMQNEEQKDAAKAASDRARVENARRRKNGAGKRRNRRERRRAAKGA